MQDGEITHLVIGAALEVHRALGPGLLESAYQRCLCRELELRHARFSRELALPVVYKGFQIDCSYRIDLLIEEVVVVEVKAVETLLPIHVAQVLTYLRLGNWKVGLLINFNVPVLTMGIRRLIL